ncbi:hypothetical protein N5U12_04445 [Aliarcobacter butzleri]|uniref:hypothetical protein n=1 Tax=Aliarcobacter butzleri TaxID=28197 RepID=UPI0021B3F845|nr:hypothetical protein [Aliarcobacter butzleri]MCT7581223.1 hypothetical protein [Aliarcobacter butzleri]
MQIEKLFKILFNPFRLLSLFFLYIGYFFGYFANLFDTFVNSSTKKINIVEDKTKNITINENVGKFLILILLLVLTFIWYVYLNKENL